MPSGTDGYAVGALTAAPCHSINIFFTDDPVGSGVDCQVFFGHCLFS